jgi:TonB-dependent SusC/RagA subfamily outer membrane receptor
MRNIYVSIFLLLLVYRSAGQDVVNSRISSYYTFIYKITNREAGALHKNGIIPADHSYLHSLHDFFPTDSAYTKHLPVGHYLYVKSVADQFEYELKSLTNLDLHILNNNRDLILVFQDRFGKEITTIQPRINGHTIPFDSKLNAYRSSRTNRQGMIAAEHEGHTNFFSISRRYNNTFPVRVKRTVFGVFPLNHLLSPISYTISSTKSLIKYGRVSAPGIYYRIRRGFEPRQFEGYMTLNQPKYKPGDTLRLKAFVTTKKGKPISKNLAVELVNYDHRSRYQKKLGQLSPYRKGAYVFEMPVADTLKLVLDKFYTVTLNRKHNNNFPSERFHFEQYELKQNFFSIKGSPSNIPDKPASVLLKGSDSNDMPLYDVRVDLLMKPMHVRDFYGQSVFIPDTLWFHRGKLEPLGDTRINLPDSVYPAASLDYDVVAVFTNADNERHLETLSLSYDQHAVIESKLEKDSIWIHSGNQESMLWIALNTTLDTLDRKMIRPPFREKIDPAVREYHVWRGDRLVKVITMYSEPHDLQVMAQRTKDSLFIAVQNPRNIPFRYQLFKSNTIIERGYGQAYAKKDKANPHSRYYVSLQYMWAGEARQQNYDLAFPKKPLTIDLHHPSSVFPGQQTDFEIEVIDAFGKPVEDADLTAYAITKKFRNTESPSIPSFERFKSRKVFNEFSPRSIQAVKASQKLEYDFWQKKLGLDSIRYYHFLYPDKGLFLQHTDAEEGITQVAPFVVKDGAIQPVHYIYFDRELKYYHETQSIEPYSFRANVWPVKTQTITIRLRDRMLSMSNMPIEIGKKLILSIDLDKLPDSIRTVEMPAKLTDEEIRKLRPHFLWVSRTPLQANAYLQQGDDFHLLKPDDHSWQMVGPFVPGPVKYQTSFELKFNFKPMMRYEFEPGLIDRETHEHTFSGYLPWGSFRRSLKDQVQTEKRIQQYWKSLEQKPSYSFRRPYPDMYPLTKETGRLAVRENYSGSRVKRLATFILNLDQPDEYYLFPPGQLEFSPLLPGLYQVIVVYDNEHYIRPEPIAIKAFGTTYFDLNNETVREPDDFSREVLKKVMIWAQQNNYVGSDRMREAQDIRQRYYQEMQPVYDGSGRWVSGVVTDDIGDPLPGVNVMVKGTSIGATTDVNGFYRMYVPHDAELVFSFIGFKTQEVYAGGQSEVHAQLYGDVMQLSEIVVTGFGVTSKLAMTTSIATVENMLAGKVAGVQISGASDSMVIRIRGASAMAANNPLVIIDGVLRRFEEIDYSKVTAIEVLKSEQAVSLYGSRAANGVILISTRPGVTNEQLLQMPLPDAPQLVSIEGSTPGSSLRKNFRDYAFWQPNLRTDKKGMAKFSATFPDDITGWRIHVLGMATKKRTGITSGQVQSFKPLIAQLALPTFLVEGDSAWAIGKITNYSADSLTLSQTITVNGQLYKEGAVEIRNSLIDSLALTGTGDSLVIKYEIEHKGYRDGELRKLAVFPKGTLESSGIFVSLTKDTTFTITYDHPVPSLTLFAQADLLDVLIDEINILKAYPYECNEQLASKLKALLAEKTIRDFRKEKFAQEKLVEKILKKLISQQNADGGWGWWTSGKSKVWITLHVATALDWAAKLSYHVSYDRTGLRSFLMKPPSGTTIDEQVHNWIYLLRSGEKVITRSLADTLARLDKPYPNYYKLLSMYLLQLNGTAPDWKWIEKERHETLKGNYYWGEENQTLWDNHIDNTLLVYCMLEHRNVDDPDLVRIRNYFVEKRNRSWRNTYESSRIVEAMLPSLQRQQNTGKPSLHFGGDYTGQVREFPFEDELKDVRSLTVSKTGNDPVYFTAYETRWTPDPEPVAKDFIIQTRWKDGVKNLKAGKPVTLEVSLELKKDADYVMINVPIPAGCTYEFKDQSRTDGESHREYDIHETRIYCEKLRSGKYVYAIRLQPRFKGRYTVNPAKVEWMYFPVIYGRNEARNVQID